MDILRWTKVDSKHQAAVYADNYSLGHKTTFQLKSGVSDHKSSETGT